MTYDDEIIDLAAAIESTGSAEAVHLSVDTQREEAQAWLHAHSERLSEDLADGALSLRLRVKCEKGCPMLDIYDHPDRRVGSIVVKRTARRGKDHAEHEATARTTATFIAPVEALIAASGNGPIGLLFSCERHIEASLSPDALRWLARREGRVETRFRDLVEGRTYPYSEMDVRRAPGLTGGTVSVTVEPLEPPDIDTDSSSV